MSHLVCTRLRLTFMTPREIVPTMNSSNERESFSERLQQALKNDHYSPDSPTRLAREFNIRFGGRPITVEWLRFGGEGQPGDGEIHVDSAQQPRFESSDVKLIADLQRLDEHHREIAREFIRMLVRVHHQNQAK